MAIILTITAVFLLLVGSELWWRTQKVHDEFSRKFVHITVGSFVAFWPFFLSWGQIQLLSLAFLLVVALSKYLHFFQAIHSVQRPTWGEIFFALAVGAITLVTHNAYIYAAAVLHMSLADGLAAVIGTRFGKSQRYIVFGHVKTLIGSLAFLLIAVAILLWYNSHAAAPLSLAAIMSIAVGTTLIENLAVQGLDNLLVPLLVAALLARF